MSRLTSCPPASGFRNWLARKSLARISALSAIALALFAAPATSRAATFQWTGTTNGNLSGTATNYSPNGTPGSADIIEFNAATYTNPPTMNGTFTLGALWFAGGDTAGVTIGGASALTLNAATVNGNLNIGIEMDSGSGAVAVNAPLILGAAQTWLNNSANTLTIGGSITNSTFGLTIAGSGNTTINGAFTGTTSGGLTMSGTGTLTLTAQNTYTGNTI